MTGTLVIAGLGPGDDALVTPEVRAEDSKGAKAASMDARRATMLTTRPFSESHFF